MTDRDAPELRAELVRLGLGDAVDVLAPHAAFELALVSDADGRSRIGGSPDMPPDLAWPCHRWSRVEVSTWPAEARTELEAARAAGQVRDDGDELVMPLAFLAQVEVPGGYELYFASLSTPLADDRVAHRVAAAVRRVRGVLAPVSPPPSPDPPIAPRPVRLERQLVCRVPWELEQSLGRHREALRTLGAVRDALHPAPIDEVVPMPPAGYRLRLRLVDHPELGLHVGDASWLTFCTREADVEDALATVFIG